MFAGGLPNELSEGDILQVFSQYGEIECVPARSAWLAPVLRGLLLCAACSFPAAGCWLLVADR